MNTKNTLDSNHIKNNQKTVLQILRTFQVKDNKKSFFIVLSTGLSSLVLILLGGYIYTPGNWLFLVTWPFLIIALCRSFIVVHDSAHLALFDSKVHNTIAGNVIGFFVMIPCGMWRYIHNLHHASTGNLDKRHINPELWTMTSDEYVDSPYYKRLFYRINRSAFMRVVVTPLALFIVARIPFPQLSSKAKKSVIIYDVVYGVVFSLVVHYQLLEQVFFAYLIPLYIFYVLASLIFYLQHQFEDTVWLESNDWNFYDAAFSGSSYLSFSPFFQWVTGNVGFHHLHHLNSKIPFYNLSKAHDSIKKYVDNKPVKFSEIFKHLNKKIWDKDQQRLINYSEIK